jgi:hypothetical protein
MNEIQLQKQKIMDIDSKLGKIADLLEVLVKMQEEESYPPESKMKKSFIAECQKILKGIRSGKIKTHAYDSMAEFTKTIS